MGRLRSRRDSRLPPVLVFSLLADIASRRGFRSQPKTYVKPTHPRRFGSCHRRRARAGVTPSSAHRSPIRCALLQRNRWFPDASAVLDRKAAVRLPVVEAGGNRLLQGLVRRFCTPPSGSPCCCRVRFPKMGVLRAPAGVAPTGGERNPSCLKASRELRRIADHMISRRKWSCL